MYLEHYQLKKKPFGLTPGPDFFWFGEKHKEALATLKYGIMGDLGFLLLTGEVGVGKTALIHRLLNSLDASTLVAHITDPGLGINDFFRLMAVEFGIDTPFQSKGEFLIILEQFLRQADKDNKKVLLIVDEAQRLNNTLLDQIRVLSNIELGDRKLINIFFIGQPEFKEQLMASANRPIRQRIAIYYHVQPLDETETKAYIEHRLKMAGAERQLFRAGAIREIFRFTNGYPRAINIICDHALLTGYASGLKSIDKATITECAHELDIAADVSSIRPTRPKPFKKVRSKSPTQAPQPQPAVESNRLFYPALVAVGVVLVTLTGYLILWTGPRTPMPPRDPTDLSTRQSINLPAEKENSQAVSPPTETTIAGVGREQGNGGPGKTKNNAASGVEASRPLPDLLLPTPPPPADILVQETPPPEATASILDGPAASVANRTDDATAPPSPDGAPSPGPGEKAVSMAATVEPTTPEKTVSEAQPPPAENQTVIAEADVPPEKAPPQPAVDEPDQAASRTEPTLTGRNPATAKDQTGTRTNQPADRPNGSDTAVGSAETGGALAALAVSSTSAPAPQTGKGKAAADAPSQATSTAKTNSASAAVSPTGKNTATKPGADDQAQMKSGNPPKPGTSETPTKPAIEATAAIQPQAPGTAASSPVEKAVDKSLEDRLKAFLQSYCSTYAAKDLNAFTTFFAPDALENGKPFDSLLPKYQRNFSLIDTIYYRIELQEVTQEDDGETIKIEGNFFLRWLPPDKQWRENAGKIIMSLTANGSSFLVHRLDYHGDRAKTE